VRNTKIVRKQLSRRVPRSENCTYN